MSAAALLDRLERIRQTGPGRWLARCPAHEDRSPSLSVRELDDGRCLIHCFAGCVTEDVLASVGFNWQDLMSDRLTDVALPRASRIPASDVLAAIDHEAHVVALIAADFLEHRNVDEPTWARLASAVAKIGKARAQAAPARIRK